MRSLTTMGFTLALLTLGTLSGAAGCGQLTEGGIETLAYTPDGRLLAFVPGQVRIFDADARQVVKTIDIPWTDYGYDGTYRVTVSSDGSTLAVGVGNDVDVFAVQSGNHLATIKVYDAPEEKNPIFGVALSPDGTRVAVAVRPVYFGPARLAVWKVDDQSLLADFQQPSERKFWLWGEGLAFSTDGKILYALDVDGTTSLRPSTFITALKIFDGTTVWENTVATDPGADYPLLGPRLALSPDGTTVVTAGSRLLRWSAADGTLLDSSAAVSLPRPPHFIAFSPDATSLVTTGAGVDYIGQDPQLFTLNGTAVSPWPIAEKNTCSTARFSPDGTRIAAACSPWLQIWDAASGAKVQSRKVTGTVY